MSNGSPWYDVYFQKNWNILNSFENILTALSLIDTCDSIKFQGSKMDNLENLELKTHFSAFASSLGI